MNIFFIHDSKSLIKYIGEGYQPVYLFFWGHHARKDGQLGKQCLSQWWPCSFTIDHRHYSSSEQFLMAEKARLFGDEATLAKILLAAGPAEAKDLGRNVKNFDENTWEMHRVEYGLRANEAKFGQNEALAEFLLGTGSKVLVEASPVDTIWGIGWAESDSHAGDPTQWRGLNLLGFMLMDVRSRLRGVSVPGV